MTLGAKHGRINVPKALGDVHYMRDEYAAVVERYAAALALGQAIGDFTSQLNSLKGLAFTSQAQNDLENACRYAKTLLALADSHPFFKTHPVVQNWCETFAGWGCG